MKEQCRDKLEDNKKNSNGDVLWCSSCDSIKHLLLRCPHSWENMANSGEEESSDVESTLFTMGEAKIVMKEQQSEEEDESGSEVDETIYMAADEE